MSNPIDNLNGYASTRIDQIMRSSPTKAAQSQPQNTAEAPRVLDRSDRVELSAEALNTEGVRTDLVARIRAEIAAGTYETDSRINAAVQGLAKDLEL